MAIVTLILWVITAGAGVSLLSTGGAARRLAAQARQEAQPPGDAARQTADTPTDAVQPAHLRTAALQAAGHPAGAAEAAQTPPRLAARLAAPPRTPDGKPPPVPRVTVPTPAGEHPLLEFSHPMLAIVGLACWLMFVFVHYQPLAWIAFGILLVTIALGLTWMSRNTRGARRHASAAWRFPPRLVAAHGLAAGISIALTVLTALTASRG